MSYQTLAGMVRRARVVLVLSALAAACTNGTTGGTPSITFTEVPAAAEGSALRVASIAGRVSGARSNQRVVLFAKSGVWWVQPFVERPFTEVAADGTWKTVTHLGMEYAALLVDDTYQPSPTTESLPAAGGAIVAIVTQEGGGSYTPPPKQVLTFSGIYRFRTGCTNRSLERVIRLRIWPIAADGHVSFARHLISECYRLHAHYLTRNGFTH